MSMSGAFDFGGTQNIMQINSSADIVNPVKKELRNISIADTVTTPPSTSLPSTVFHFRVPAGWGGMWLHSFSIVYDNEFQQYYSYVMIVQGVSDDNATYQLPDPTALTYDYVPIGKRIKVGQNASIDVYVYNSNSATSAGVLSVNLIGDLIPAI